MPSIFTCYQGAYRIGISAQCRVIHLMRQRDLKLFRKLLEGRRRDILEEAERAVGTMNGVEEAYADPTDRASLESDRNFLLRMRDRERKLLGKIDEAFTRLDDGSYGLCEECGGDIGVERLKARPVTTLCIACKSAQEAREQKT
ncbi:MAG TPA: RNA polymerase-binding protein DksA [Candidatus Binataceae bacterium]|nr:RNA polymerase-binding protein DksA [Candidatus Binataceae bacterium]